MIFKINKKYRYGKIYHYNVFYEGSSIWLNSNDFLNNKELLKVLKEREVTNLLGEKIKFFGIEIKEPIEDFYQIEKKKNSRGEFLVLQPKTFEQSKKEIIKFEELIKLKLNSKKKKKKEQKSKKILFIEKMLAHPNKKKVDDSVKKKLFELVERGKGGIIEVGEEGIKNGGKKKIREHNPKHVADFMSLFNDREGLKYLTHAYDKMDDFEIESFLTNAKKKFNEKTKKYNIPQSLYAIVFNFAFKKNPDWSSFNEEFEKKDIKEGWSTDDWINWSKENKKHPIKEKKFEKIINDFRMVTRIETPQLYEIFNNSINEIIGDEQVDYEIDLKDLEKADFYTHIPSFKIAIDKIIKEIKKKAEYKKFSIKYERGSEDDYYIRKIIITHFDSYPTKELKLLLKEWRSKGDMDDIYDRFKGYCNWSVETKIEGNPIRVNILKEKKTKDTEEIDEKQIEGFKHILTFYYK